MLPDEEGKVSVFGGQVEPDKADLIRVPVI